MEPENSVLTTSTMHPNLFSSQFLPSDWVATSGKGIKIALLDTGCILTHPGLTHLQIAGRCFDTTVAGYNSATATGTDDITEVANRNVFHGTQSAGLLAGQADAAQGVAGLAPDAELYLLKIRDAAQETYLDHFMLAIATCIRLDVDIIACPYAPVFREPWNRDALADMMKTLQQNNIALFTTRPNTSKLVRLNTPEFPSDQAFAINSVVLNEELVQSIQNPTDLSSDIHLMTPASNLTCFTHPDSGNYVRRTMKNSHFSVMMAGVAALAIAHNRVQGGSARLTHSDLLLKLKMGAQPFNIQQIKTTTGLIPFANP